MKASVPEQITSDKGVRAPDFSFTMDCESPPATTYPLENAAARFAAPSDSNSCLGRTR